MRRRMNSGVHTGLGNPAPEIFDNKWTNNTDFNDAVRAFFDDVLKSEKAFSDFGGFDFKIDFRPWGFTIKFGIEPAYKHDPYVCYCLDSNKDDICVYKGKAHSYYGSDIRISSVRRYKDGSLTKKYQSLVDKHYDKLVSFLV